MFLFNLSIRFANFKLLTFMLAIFVKPCYNLSMLKVSNIKVPYDFDFGDLTVFLAGYLGVSQQFLSNVKLVRKSIDARKKPNIYYILTVAFDCSIKIDCNKDITSYKQDVTEFCDLPYQNSQDASPVVVVGSGPSGLFATLTLLNFGRKVILIERGQCVEERNKSIDDIKKGKAINKESNIQFGEGGAGTYSDGKLNSGVKSMYTPLILNTFVSHGAPSDILYLAKPHIGSDYLQIVLKSIRKQILDLGGEILFNTKLVDVEVKNDAVSAIKVQCGGSVDTIETQNVILATGHSAEDTYRMLYEKGVQIGQKAFSLGVRIEHLQREINFSQYGTYDNALPSAEYKLVSHNKNGRSAYTFCMCPGGEVVCSSSENGIVTNGMSNYARDGVNANSALLVNVGGADYGSDHAFAGYDFKNKYEKQAFNITNSFSAPIQRVGDFLNDKTSSAFGEVKPTYLPGVNFFNIKKLLPDYITDTLHHGILELDNKLIGFSHHDALLTGIETRSSSPIRIFRDENCQSNIKGIYPAGEGAGYAGGIISSCKDGITVATNLLTQKN